MARYRNTAKEFETIARASRADRNSALRKIQTFPRRGIIAAKVKVRCGVTNLAEFTVAEEVLCTVEWDWEIRLVTC